MDRYTQATGLPPLPLQSLTQLQQLIQQLAPVSPTPTVSERLAVNMVRLAQNMRTSKQHNTDTTKSAALFLGNGFLVPGQLIGHPSRSRFKELIRQANTVCGIDVFEFHSMFSNKRDVSFEKELLDEHITTHSLRQHTHDLYHGIPYAQFALGPCTILTMIDAILSWENHNKRPSILLPFSSGIFSVAYITAQLPFDSLCDYIYNGLEKETARYEKQKAKQILGTPQCDTHLVQQAYRVAGPGMIAVFMVNRSLVTQAVKAYNATYGCDCQIGLYISPTIHIVVGMRYYLYGFEQFLKKHYKIPLFTRIKPVNTDHGSHHPSYIPVSRSLQHHPLGKQVKRSTLRFPVMSCSSNHDIVRSGAQLWEQMHTISHTPVALSTAIACLLDQGVGEFQVYGHAATSFTARVLVDAIAQHSRKTPSVLCLT